MFEFEEMEEMGGLEARRRGAAKVQVGAKGIRLKGYNVSSQVGTVTTTITQPGNMRNLIGLNVYQDVAFTSETISLTINSERVLDNVAAKDICPETHQVSDPVIRISRPLTGNDDIKLEFTSNTAGRILNATFYFSPIPPKSIY
jgi:autotransporter adhesin